MDNHIEDLNNQREIIRKKSYVLMFEIFVIFGLPAFLAYLLGRYLINKFFLESYIWIFVLLPAFILGWVIFFIRFRKITGELKEINKKIKEAKKS